MSELHAEQFLGLAKVMPWPYLLCDREGKVIYSNAHFERLLDLSHDSSKGISLATIFSTLESHKPVTDILLEVSTDEAWHGKWNFLEGGERLTIELVVQVDPSNDDLLWVIALENPVINNQMVLSTRSELRLLQILMDHTLDYVFFKDIGGRFIITNRAFQRALSVPFPGYEIGKTLGDFVEEETAHEFEETDRQVLSTYRPIINNVGLFRLRDGDSIWLQTTKMPVFNQSGKCIGLVCVGRDISASKANEEQLKQAIQRAEAANQAKSDFLANMSHEIRTPINGILGMTELCLETALEEDQSYYLKSVINCSNTLLTLVNDILDFSKIEAGQLELEEIRFDLPGCIEEAVEQFIPAARSKGLELTVRLDPAMPTHVNGDPVRLKQIFNNLLGNAVKFTQEGEISVKVNTTQTNAELVTLLIEISDTGVGISETRQKSIFESFTQADNSTTRKFGGTGLGLAICRRLAGLMGGSVSVSSELEKGSVFSVTLQMKATEEKESLAKEQLEALRGMPVLIIDDNETNRTILIEICENWGLMPQAVESGLEGLEILESAAQEGSPFPLVFLDQQMPSLSGLDVAALISNRPSLQEAKMILLSSSLSHGEKERAAQIGIQRVLAKPAKQSNLLQVVLELFNIGSQEKKSESLPSAVATVNVPTMTVLLVEDNPINQEVAVQRLERLGHEVVVAENGQKAVEAFGSTQFDLILMDVQMPIMDGFEATRQIRVLESKRESARTPIIAMTARAMRGDEQRCLEAGMDAYMAKPFHAKKFEAVVGEVIALQADGPKAAAEVLIKDRGKYQFKAILDESSDEEKADLIAAANIFLESYKRDFDLLEHYLQSSMLDQVNHQAHSIKGGAGVFDAKLLEELALQVEEAASAGDSKQVEDVLPRLKDELCHVASELKQFSA